MAEVFSSTSSEGNGTIYPVISGDYVPALDDFSFEGSLGVVDLWGGGATARVTGDAGDVSLVSGSQQPVAPQITGNSITYNIEGIVGPQGAQGPKGDPGSITTLKQQVFVPYGDADLADVLIQIRDTWGAGNGSAETILYSESVEVWWDRPWDHMPIAAITSWNDAAIDLDGSFMLVVSDAGIYVSIDTGGSWAAKTPDTEDFLQVSCSSSSGRAVVLGEESLDYGKIWVSSDAGANWSQVSLELA